MKKKKKLNKYEAVIKACLIRLDSYSDTISYYLERFWITVINICRIPYKIIRKRNQKERICELAKNRILFLYTINLDSIEKNKTSYFSRRSFFVTRDSFEDFANVLYYKTAALMNLTVELDSKDCFKVIVEARWL